MASDNFNRANASSLGTGWVQTTDNGLILQSNMAMATLGANFCGAVRNGETYTSDQSSQVEVTSQPMTAGQFIGATVRCQGGDDQSCYMAIYFNNGGAYEYDIYKRVVGGPAQIAGPVHPPGSTAVAAGTQLLLSVVGSTLTFSVNGTAVLTVTDTAFTGGAPGIVMYDNGIGTTAGATAVDNFVSTGDGGGPATVTGTVALGGTAGMTVVGAGGSIAGAVVEAATAGMTVTMPPPPGSSDNFNRANANPPGALGSNWTDQPGDQAFQLNSNMALGNNATSNNSGAFYSGTTFTSNQSSQIEVGVMLSGNQWIGPTVRVQSGSQPALYLGIYFYNGGSPILMLFRRSPGGGFNQLGATVSTSALPVGSQLLLSAVGSTITFSLNGVAQITATDATWTGGAPGMMTNGDSSVTQPPSIDNWVGTSVTAGPSPGAVAMASAAGMTVGAAPVQEFATVNEAATAGMTVGGAVQEVAAVNEAATAGLSVAGLVTELGLVPLSATAGMSVGGSVQHLAAVSMSVTSGLLTGSGTQNFGIVSMSSSAGLVANASVQSTTAVSMSGTGGLSIAGSVTEIAAVHPTATAGLSVAGSVLGVGVVVMSATAHAVMTATTAAHSEIGQVVLFSQGFLYLTGPGEQGATFQAAATASLSVAALVHVGGFEVNLLARSAMGVKATSQSVLQMQVAMGATASMTVNGTVERMGVVVVPSLEDQLVSVGGQDPILMGATAYLDPVFTTRLHGDTE